MASVRCCYCVADVFQTMRGGSDGKRKALRSFAFSPEDDDVTC
jgi:hypothetical protein